MAHKFFTSKTFALTGKEALKKEILTAVESSKELKQEIRRVFQVANRRIQNLENSDSLVSPSLEALGKQDIKGFTKFSMRGDWDTLKREYAKAIGFLRQPTSTVTGTREYNKHIQSEYNLTNDEFALMAQSINDKLTSLSGSDFVDRYLMRYKDFTGELETEASDISTQIESDAQRIENAIDNAIDNAVNTLDSSATDDLQRLFDSFGL